MLELLVRFDKDTKSYRLFVVDENDEIIYRPTLKDIFFSKELLKHSLGVK